MVISAHCAPFRDPRGRNLGVITVLHDITALKQMDRMKSEFVSMVSHEIRGPMNSVNMQLQVLLDGLAGELTTEQRNILERASGKIVSLCEMTSELLDLARIESGLISLEREPVDMAELIREQVALHGPRAADANIEMKVDIPDSLPSLLGHRRNLEEVLSNLITNAIKYSPAGGTDPHFRLCKTKPRLYRGPRYRAGNLRRRSKKHLPTLLSRQKRRDPPNTGNRPGSFAGKKNRDCAPW